MMKNISIEKYIGGLSVMLILIFAKIDVLMGQSDTLFWKKYSDSLGIHFKYPTKYTLKQEKPEYQGYPFSVSLNYVQYDTSRGNPYDLSPTKDTSSVFVEYWKSTIKLYADTCSFDTVAVRMGFVGNDSNSYNSDLNPLGLSYLEWNSISMLKKFDHFSTQKLLWSGLGNYSLSVLNLNDSVKIIASIEAEKWGEEQGNLTEIMRSFNTPEMRYKKHNRDSIQQAQEEFKQRCMKVNQTWNLFDTTNVPVSFKVPPCLEIRKGENDTDWIIGYETMVYSEYAYKVEDNDTVFLPTNYGEDDSLPTRVDTTQEFVSVVNFYVTTSTFIEIADKESFGHPRIYSDSFRGYMKDSSGEYMYDTTQWVSYGRQGSEEKAECISFEQWNGLQGKNFTGAYSYRGGYAGLSDFIASFFMKKLDDQESVVFSYYEGLHSELGQVFENQFIGTFNISVLKEILSTVVIKNKR